MSQRDFGKIMAPPPQRFDAEVSARLQAILGMDPRETLDKLRDAQKQTADLRREEAMVVAKLATYKARYYGHPSFWEHERKALLARLKSHERDRLLRLGDKVTEGLLDDYAHAHGEYMTFLNEAKREREKMEDLDAELTDVRGRIEIARGVEQFYERHARLNDGLVYFSGKEMGLS
jgi:hypothetical protein